MKKIMFLGAAGFQLPPIHYALEQGYQVITCDNVPQNPGHKLAHKAYNISTVDREGILAAAQVEMIDGILTYGSDVSAPTVAYVAEQLGLPGNPYQAVQTLTDKAKFRAFLNDSGLQPLAYKTFGASERMDAHHHLGEIALPAVVKPVDASGSKGVSILANLDQAALKIDNAFAASLSNRIIIETYVQKHQHQVCGDGFVENGHISFIEFGDGHYYDDGEFLAPYAETFPSLHKPEHLHRVQAKLDAIINAVGLQFGAFNFDVLITATGEPFVIEIGPRNGGNFIPQAILLSRNVDLIAATVETAHDRTFKLNTIATRSKKFYACYMIHTRHWGVLWNVDFGPEIQANIVQFTPYLTTGAAVDAFRKANNAIGNLILSFDTMVEMHTKINNMANYITLELTEATPVQV